MEVFCGPSWFWSSMAPLLLLMLLVFNGVGFGSSLRPSVVNVGAVLTFNSTIGRVAKIAIQAAVEDVNANSSVLGGSRLNISMQDTNRSGFIGIVEALQFMETDTVAIIGPQSSVIAHVISHLANELQVPLVSFAATDPTLSSLQYPYFIRSTASDLYQMSAITAFVDFYRWKEVIAIFSDDDYGRGGVSALGDKLAERRCKISHKVALSPSIGRAEITDALVQLALMESRVIIVHVNLDVGPVIFSVADHLSMMSSGYVWIATNWLTTVMDTKSPLDENTMRSLQGVISFRQHVQDSKQKSAFISRWSSLVKQAGYSSLGLNNYGLYAYDAVWLVARAIDSFLRDGGNISFSSDLKLRDIAGGGMNLDSLSVFNGGNVLRSKILGENFTGLTGQVQFSSDGNLVYPAYDVLNVIGTGIRKIGYWSNYSGLTVVPPETLYDKPYNVSSTNDQLLSVIWPGDTTTKPRGWVFPNNGKQLRVGVPNRASYKEFVSLVKGTDIMKGFCTDVFIQAANMLPYAVPFKFVPFGDGISNPNYNELVSLVASNVYDAAVGDIAIVTNRTRIVDFTQPFIESGLVVVAPTRKMNSGAWAFLRPFTFKLWCATAAFFIVMGAVVWVLEHRINDDFRGPPQQQIVTVLWFSFSTLFFAHRESTVSTLGRFVLIFWLFVVLIINSSYTASLTSILTVQQLSSPIKGIESLIASDDPIGYQIGSFAENYLIELGISKSRLIPLGSPEAYAEALDRGRSRGGVVAVIDELPYVEVFLSKHCEYSIRGKAFTKSGWGFAFPRDSPLADDFSTALLTIAETGDLQRIHDKWLTTSACSSDSNDLTSNQLDLNSFWGLFLICGIASFVALFIFFTRMLILYSRHGPDPSKEESSMSGSSRSRRLRRFFSFVDEKEEKLKSRSSRTQSQGSFKTYERSASQPVTFSTSV